MREKSNGKQAAGINPRFAYSNHRAKSVDSEFVNSEQHAPSNVLHSDNGQRMIKKEATCNELSTAKKSSEERTTSKQTAREENH